MLSICNPGFVLNTIVCTNVLVFLSHDPSSISFFDRNDKFSINSGATNMKMLLSMFHHASFVHLVSNMILLYLAGRVVFIDSVSPIWRNGISLALLYFGSGLAGDYFTIFVAKQLRNLWDKSVEAAQEKVSFKSPLLSWTINPILRPLTKLYVHVARASDFTSILSNEKIERIGASGGVYGVVGAYLFTALQSRFHPHRQQSGPIKWLSISVLVFEILRELGSVPVSVESLRESVSSGDRIDHTAHVGGLMFGFCNAILLHGASLLISHLSRRRIAL